MNRVRLVLLYTMFAVVATLCNLGVQRVILLGGTEPVTLACAMFAGTLVGLTVKFSLDKRWVFGDQTTGFKPQSIQFAFYSFNGIFTTAIFWLSEAGFWLVWQTETMRETGAIIGLIIGYIAKFYLDHRFVFAVADEEV